MATPPEGSTPAEFEEGYQELRAIAGAYVRRFADSDSLQATALVHEVYLKLAQGSARFADHAHFVRTAATAMRHILVDHARARQRTKRGGEFTQVTLSAVDVADAAASGREIDVLALDEALARLAEWDARQAQIVELRFFVGLSVEEAADVLSISEKTVKRDWAMARAWLQRELGPAA